MLCCVSIFALQKRALKERKEGEPICSVLFDDALSPPRDIVCNAVVQHVSEAAELLQREVDPRACLFAFCCGRRAGAPVYSSCGQAMTFYSCLRRDRLWEVWTRHFWTDLPDVDPITYVKTAFSPALLHKNSICI